MQEEDEQENDDKDNGEEEEYAAGFDPAEYIGGHMAEMERRYMGEHHAEMRAQGVRLYKYEW